MRRSTSTTLERGERQRADQEVLPPASKKKRNNGKHGERHGIHGNFCEFRAFPSIPLFLLTVEVFDEDYFIAALIVDEFIYELIGEQNAEATGAQAFLIAHGDMTEGVA